MLRVSNIRLRIDLCKTKVQEEVALRREILLRLKLPTQQMVTFQIRKKSIDARKKEMIYFIYTLDVEVAKEEEILKKNPMGVSPSPHLSSAPLPRGRQNLGRPPIIVGTGPAGLFAGLRLARMGYAPLLLERGEAVDARTLRVDRFWQDGILDPTSNVQFGEGGSGTFSDGKLTTLINDPRSHLVLKEFVKAGAPEEILYTHKPHIGTDILKQVVKRIRETILDLGGQIRFQAQVTDFQFENNHVRGVIINGSEMIEGDVVLLGIGHSARDTFETLYQKGVHILPKPFSIGVRIEHPQSLIDEVQYGPFAGHPSLGAADYKLVHHTATGRSAYTFCMCPGGTVVGASSEIERVVTNGMSEYRRDGSNANAALLVGVSPSDFGSDHPLAGMAFQRKWESLAFEMAGGNYRAPVQLVGDFLKGQLSSVFGDVYPTYQPGVTFVKLEYCLPHYVLQTMKEALVTFDRQIPGFARQDAILTGVETRSSSPIRIQRDDSYQSNLRGLYPMGEGAGYAGGIMSSAIDGIRVAEGIIGETT